MPHLSIKDVPEPVAERLRQRAARHHRSLQGELMAIVTQAVAEEDVPPPGRARSAVESAAVRTPAGKTIEQIAAEHRARWPKPVRGGPRAMQIVRAERDAR